MKKVQLHFRKPRDGVGLDERSVKALVGDAVAVKDHAVAVFEIERVVLAKRRKRASRRSDDQVKRGGKSVVKRNVIRLVTPGTLTEETLLDARSNNYLLAIARVRDSGDQAKFALAWIDISTGEFRVATSERC